MQCLQGKWMFSEFMACLFKTTVLYCSKYFKTGGNAYDSFDERRRDSGMCGFDSEKLRDRSGRVRFYG